MIELDLYRLRIGSYNPASSRIRCRKPQVCKHPGKPGIPAFNTLSTVQVSMCLLYLYFVIVVLALLMSMSIAIYGNTKQVPFLFHPFQLGNKFYYNMQALVHVKHLFCIIMAIFYRSMISNKNVIVINQI